MMRDWVALPADWWCHPKLSLVSSTSRELFIRLITVYGKSRWNGSLTALQVQLVAPQLRSIRRCMAELVQSNCVSAAPDHSSYSINDLDYWLRHWDKSPAQSFEGSDDGGSKPRARVGGRARKPQTNKQTDTVTRPPSGSGRVTDAPAARRGAGGATPLAPGEVVGSNDETPPPAETADAEAAAEAKKELRKALEKLNERRNGKPVKLLPDGWSAKERLGNPEPSE